MKLFIGLALTLAATVLAAFGGWQVASSDLSGRDQVPDRVQAAIDGLRESHVYVAPDSANLLTDEQRVALASKAAATNPQTFVIVWAKTYDAGSDSTLEAVQQMATALDERGRYVVLAGDDDFSRDLGVDADYVSSYRPPDEPEPANLADDIAQRIMAGDDRDYSNTSIEYSDYWAGTGGAISAGVIMGALTGAGVAAVLAVVWLIARSRLRRR